MSKQVLSVFIFFLLASCNKSSNTPSKEAIISTDIKNTEPKKLEKIIIEDGKGEDVEVQVEDWVGIDPYTLETLLNKCLLKQNMNVKIQHHIDRIRSQNLVCWKTHQKWSIVSFTIILQQILLVQKVS